MIRSFRVHLYGPDRGPLALSFEAAAEVLENLPMVHFEPDGSFVWTCDAARQQVFGMLYDAANRLQYVELQGKCDRSTWQAVCVAVAGRDRNLSIVSLDLGSVQDLQSFEQTTWSEA